MHTKHISLLESISPGLHIDPLDQEHIHAAQNHLNSLTKPRGSLGRLETLACRLFAISSGALPLSVSPALMLTVAADHGIAAQHVSPYPQAVTRQMVQNFLHGGAAINVLCNISGLDLRIVDAGCCGGAFPQHPMLVDRRLGDGTADFSQGSAMQRMTCLKGLRMGVELAQKTIQSGYRCLGIGEMGIANSTAATALYCAFLRRNPEDMTGPGAGADKTMIGHKIHVVRKALEVNKRALLGDAIDILAAFGGFEIVLMTGLLLGAAAQRVPVLVDGFISSAAYVAALAICPAVSEYAILAHSSAEPGHLLALHQLTGAVELDTPLLHLGLRLGEGTGGAIAYHLLRCASAIFNGMATFNAAGVLEKPC
ncbi:MAG: nicotinate-nucleotide--dimethylbenzimidazole phosphoribosyltransferase [Desulfovibrio sp.]|nr:nicotinate-nucleotide--dimethylbenzimidazole phosphoribosyltransferase [Desulfovibrio sp.]